ncbi:hypothetical protein [Bradyrhizobium sp.]
MKFAMSRTGAWPVEGERLLQAMLQHFRRIHAAKRDFRACSGRRFCCIYKLIQEVDRYTAAPRQIVACCTYAAANPQHNPRRGLT